MKQSKRAGKRNLTASREENNVFQLRKKKKERNYLHLKRIKERNYEMNDNHYNEDKNKDN